VTGHTPFRDLKHKPQPDRARLRELLEAEILQAVQEESGIDHVAARELYAAFNAVRGERDAALDRLDEVEDELHAALKGAGLRDSMQARIRELEADNERLKGWLPASRHRQLEAENERLSKRFLAASETSYEGPLMPEHEAQIRARQFGHRQDVEAVLRELDRMRAENERLRRYEAILYPPEEEP